MITRELEIADLGLEGAFLIKPKEFRDERGAFYKLFTRQILESKGIKPLFYEEYLSISRRGVIRGLHYQTEPYVQAKLVQCTRGEIFDVIVDLRKDSKTFGKWESVSLSEENRFSLYVPRGFAHGFLALAEDTEVLYKADNDYAPENELGLLWNDKSLQIAWPNIDGGYLISEKDKKWPNFATAKFF